MRHRCYQQHLRRDHSLVTLLFQVIVSTNELRNLVERVFQRCPITSFTIIPYAQQVFASSCHQLWSTSWLCWSDWMHGKVIKIYTYDILPNCMFNSAITLRINFPSLPYYVLDEPDGQLVFPHLVYTPPPLDTDDPFWPPFIPAGPPSPFSPGDPLLPGFPLCPLKPWSLLLFCE